MSQNCLGQTSDRRATTNDLDCNKSQDYCYYSCWTLKSFDPSNLCYVDSRLSRLSFITAIIILDVYTMGWMIPSHPRSIADSTKQKQRKRLIIMSSV